MRVAILFERSGKMREAFRALGHDAWSNDLVPADDGSPHHFMCDYREVLRLPWDLMIAHPVCTFLTNSAVRWMDHGRNAKRMRAMRYAAAVYAEVALASHIPLRAIENPVMHSYAREELARLSVVGVRQVVQPWWFGDPTFKAIGFHLFNLPKLVPTNKLVPPMKGTDEHKAWSWVHRCPPGPDRARIRAETQPGLAAACASQWAITG